jgi:hypothetical protein
MKVVAVLSFALLAACAATPPNISLKCPDFVAAPPPADAGVLTKPTMTSSGSHEERGEEIRFYRLDFVLHATDSAATPKTTETTSLSIALGEHDRGDVRVGKNVPLAVTTTGASPRQDVGVRVAASIRNIIGSDVMLDVSTEISALESAGTIRKVSSEGRALAPSGKPTTVLALDEGTKHYELSVTPTKLR